MFITISAKKLVSIIVAVLLVASLTVVGVVTGSRLTVGLPKSDRLVPIYRVETPSKVVALTFDAAWGADKTSRIMDILEEHSVKGTFFLVGFWVDKYPDMTKSIHDRGHLIGNHSKNHLKMSTIGKDEIVQEIDSVNKAIYNIVGETPTFFRPPFGDYNNALIEETSALDMKTIQWDVDSLDWKGLSGVEIANRVNSKVKNGSIVLCHNNSDHILDALPLILKYLKDNGYTAVTLDEMVYSENYTINKAGEQIKNK